MKRLALAGAIAVAMGSAAAAQPLGDWEQAGGRAIDPSAGSVTIFAFGSDSHRQIRVCTTTAELALLSVSITYASGETQQVETQFVIPANQCSEAIALSARRREIEQLVLTYSPFAAQGRPPRVRVDAR